MNSLLERALRAFDEINRQDPRLEDGEPTELRYARRMSFRLDALAPDASDVVVLAVRAQHIARWRIPRSDFPDGRAGYKRWRTTLGQMHADVAADAMAEVGCDAATIERVRALLTKSRLKHDPEVQLLEDVACLVFLEHYFVPFARKHGYPHDKVVDIVRKTWNKMSERGHAAALQLAPSLPADLLAAVQEAIAAPVSRRPEP